MQGKQYGLLRSVVRLRGAWTYCRGHGKRTHLATHSKEPEPEPEHLTTPRRTSRCRVTLCTRLPAEWGWGAQENQGWTDDGGGWHLSKRRINEEGGMKGRKEGKKEVQRDVKGRKEKDYEVQLGDKIRTC